MSIEHTDIHSKTEDIAVAAADADPRTANCGFFSYNDRHPAFGGGQGGFLWFPSQEALFAFLADHLVISSFPSCDEEIALMQQDVRRIIEGINSENSKEVLAKLNGALKNIVQVTWVGTFNELLSGEDQFDLKVRLGFRDGDHPDPIAPDEIGDFVGYLATYGI